MNRGPNAEARLPTLLSDIEVCQIHHHLPLVKIIVIMSNSKDLFQKGLQTRREVVGEDYVERALQNGSSEFAFAGQQQVTE